MNAMKLRRINAWISLLLVILVIFHTVTGAGIMVGLITSGFDILDKFTYLMSVLLLIHIVIGLILMADSLRIRLRTGVGYESENRLFLIRRYSGIAMILFLIVHVLLFLTIGGFVLRPFRIFQLICNICLVISIVIHMLTNLKPLLISFGMNTKDKKGRILWAVIVIVCLAGAAAFGYYFVRWNVFHEFGGWE